MSNWFEKNATKSVIVHTLFVAAAVWATFVFVFDENKVNFYDAKVQKTEAEAREIHARNSVLATRVEYLTEENRKLTEWLADTPSTIPYYERKIDELQTNLKSAEERLTFSDKPLQHETNSVYKNSKTGAVATTFIDFKTNTVFGVSKINYSNTADVNVTLPSGEKIRKEATRAGETWSFSDNGKKYLLILDSVDWASQSYKSSILEVGNETQNDTKNNKHN